MKAEVLAAGFSTRLYPLTLQFPKALLEVRGKAIIQQVLDGINATAVIDQIALITNERYFSSFQEWLNNSYQGKQITLLNDNSTDPENRLGAIGDLQFSLDQLQWDDDILVVASDTLTSLQIPEFVAFSQKHSDSVVNAVYDIGDIEKVRKRLGNPVIENGQITQFLEKPDVPHSSYVSIPYYVFPQSVLPLIRQYIKEGGNTDAPGSLIPWLVGKVPVLAYDIGKDGYYYDVGTPESLEKVRSL